MNASTQLEAPDETTNDTASLAQAELAWRRAKAEEEAAEETFAEARGRATEARAALDRVVERLGYVRRDAVADTPPPSAPKRTRSSKADLDMLDIAVHEALPGRVPELCARLNISRAQIASSLKRMLGAGKARPGDGRSPRWVAL